MADSSRFLEAMVDSSQEAEAALRIGQEADQHYSLRIGDSVLLQSKGTEGYVFSELSSSKHNSVALFSVSSKHDGCFPNVHFATFKILTANKYKKQECFNMLEEDVFGISDEAQKKSVLLQAKRDLDDETRENKAEQERHAGNSIVYGEIVQLLHTLTKKYLYVSTTKTAHTENTNLRVELKQGNSLGCLFRILPRYKVRSVGDVVQYGDQVKLESMKTEGQFLHCSGRTFDLDDIHPYFHEVNLSATESAFSFVPHYRPLPSHPPTAFRAGNCARLFHREYECYIAAEGSFAENSILVEDVHCRKRHSDHGILKAPSTSANTYWQFEKESFPCSGEPLSWGERCRIKHMPTRCYLAVVTSNNSPHQDIQYKVTLKDLEDPDFNKLDTVFTMTPAIKEGDTVLLESYALIKHLRTGTWLHLKKDVSYVRKGFDPRMPGLKGLEWDSAELFELTASTSKNFDDAFTLELVEEPLLDIFNYVAGMVPILTNYIQERKAHDAPPLVSQKRYPVETALKELAVFLETPNDRDSKNRQKLLRNLRVLELIIKTLELFSTERTDASEQRKVCQAGYRVIESYLKGDSRKNENYLARFIDIFKQQVRMGLNAEEVMIEMVEDNSAIVSKLAESEIDYMVQQLVETRDPRFMQFLGNLCVCSDRPIPSTQNKILEKLVLPHGKHVFYHTRASGTVVSFMKPDSMQWRKLDEIAGHNVSQMDCQKEREFLEAQLNLFGRMCKGNNAHVIEKLKVGHVTFEEALYCAESRTLVPSLRSQYVELIRVMFVDIGENRAVLDNLSFSFVYMDVKENPYADTGGDDETALTGVVNPNFPRMKTWIKKHLDRAEEMGVCTSEVEENKLLTQVLGVLSLLVKYGYYDDQGDVNDVLKPLIVILDGQSDLPFPKNDMAKSTGDSAKLRKHFHDHGRFQPTLENQAVFEVKKIAMDLMDLLFNFRLFIRLQRFIFDFRLLKDSAMVATPGGLHPELYRLQFGVTKVEENPLLVRLIRKRLKFISSQSAYFFEKLGYVGNFSMPQFSAIMLDLANYNCDEVVQHSLYLLNRHHSSEVNLFLKAIQTQLLLTEKSREVFEVIGKQLPILRRLMSIDAGETERSHIISILNTFAALCMLDGSKQEPHPQNQQILYNYGILTDVLNYVLFHANKKTEPVAAVQMESVAAVKVEPVAAPATYESVLAECFRFLRALARGNIEVQRRLYDRMNDLLKISVAVEYLAEMLTEVFTGGPEICLKVKEEQVQQIFNIIASGEDLRSYEFINTLQAMAKIEEVKLPVKRNQAFIIKLFRITRSKFCDHLLSESQLETRMNVLRTAKDNSYDLRLLLNMTDLLASCADGENESVCQTVFSVREILEILSDPSLSPNRKRPFARFLVSVYMNGGGDKNQSGAADLDESKEMWAYLEHLSSLLESIGKVMRTIPDTEFTDVCEGFFATNRRYSTTQHSSMAIVHTRSRAVPFVTGDDGKLLPGLLLYFSDGILPLLCIYFDQFFNPLMETDRIGRLAISGNILTALLCLSDVLTKYFTEDSQMKLYRGTVKVIMKRGKSKIPLDVSHSVIDNFELNTSGWVGCSPAREAYQAYYSAEIKLNETFNSFVSNYRRGYQGPNTARAQIGAKFNTPYSDFLDKDMEEPGDEYLPLGPSFQELVQLFVNSNAFTAIQRHAPTTRAAMPHRSQVEAEKFVKPSAERLLAQLEISFSKLARLGEMERLRQDELDIKCLQILRAIIHNEIMRIDPELKESSPSRFRKQCAVRLQPVQNRIQNFSNAIARVVPLLSHPNDMIVCEVLAFLKVILYSGNRTVQEGMKHLLTTREERLFVTMRALLQHSAVTYKERQDLSVQVKDRAAQEQTLDQTFQSRHRGDEHAKRKGESVEIAMDDKSGETIPMQSLEHSNGRGMKFHDSEAVPLVGSPQRKGRERAFSQPALDLFNKLGHGSPNTEEVHGDLDKDIVKLLHFQDSTHIKLALLVLGLMCDGQYRLMQNYLREQPDNIHNINIVGEVAMFLQVYYTDVNSETMELVHLILQTLTEMCVGNFPNQEAIFKQHIIDAINGILELRVNVTSNPKDAEDLVNLKASAVELLEALLEETTSKSKLLAQEIYMTVHVEALHSTLALFYSLKDDPHFKALGFDDEAERGLFRTFHALVHMADYPGTCTLMKLEPAVKVVQDDTEDRDTRVVHANANEAWQFCKQRSKSIEIDYENMDGEKVLTKVHFQYDPRNKLREEVIENVKWNVDRDSAESKQRDFLDWALAVKKDTVHHNRLQAHWFTHIFIAFPVQRYWILIFLTLLLNLFLLITFTLPEQAKEAKTGDIVYTLRNASGAVAPVVAYWFGGILLYILGGFHLIFSLWMAIEYFVGNLPNFVLPFWITRWFRHHKESYSDINILGFRSIYVVLFLLASGISLGFYGYFYAFCLLHIVVNNDILQRVLRSVTKNGVSLLWVAVLGLVMLYIYSVISFAFLHESFLAPDNNDGDLFCDTLFQCFFSTIRYGLTDNLGLIVPLVPTTWNTAGLRLLYDISFFIIVTTIGLNIVFGIIVDTFSELRDERFRTEQDKKSVCFICSIQSHEFDRKAKGFDDHTEHDHNMWNYIYYSIYLDTIDISDHNAIESYVYKMILEKKIGFFPLLNARVLETDEDDTAKHLEELKTMVDNVLMRFQEEEYRKTLIQKQQEQQMWELQRGLRRSLKHGLEASSI